MFKVHDRVVTKIDLGSKLPKGTSGEIVKSYDRDSSIVFVALDDQDKTLAFLVKDLEHAPGHTPYEQFVQGYIAYVEWLNDDLYVEDFPELEASIRRDCRDFFDANEADLYGYGGVHPYRWAGGDFYMTREGHGVGYWDRGLGELGERLTEAAQAFGEDTEVQTHYLDLAHMEISDDWREEDV